MKRLQERRLLRVISGLNTELKHRLAGARSQALTNGLDLERRLCARLRDRRRKRKAFEKPCGHDDCQCRYE